MKYLSISFIVFVTILLATPLRGQAGQSHEVLKVRGKPKASKAEKVMARIEKLLKEVQEASLEPWPEADNSTYVTEAHQGVYKALKSDGQNEYLKRKPRSSDGIEKLWKEEDVVTGQAIIVNGKRQYVWKRLYWSDHTKRWTFTHENEAVFKKVDMSIKQLLAMYAEISNGKQEVRTSMKAAKKLVKYKLRIGKPGLKQPKPEDMAKLQKDLKAAILKWGMTHRVASQLREIFEEDIEIRTTSVLKVKISKQKKRIVLLKQIIENVPSVQTES